MPARRELHTGRLNFLHRSWGPLEPFDDSMPEILKKRAAGDADAIKAMEARRAIRNGAREIDMVINIGALKSGDHDLVRADIARVSDACHESGAINKVIIEAALLSDAEKIIASRLAREAKADMVKTSTGYAKGGATIYDVALMRETVGPKLGVKAAGGIRTAEDVQEMIAAGATRIGASAGIKIVSGQGGASGQY